MLEPFSMKEEREIGNITKEGFFAINKEKEKQASDRWLDSLLTGQEQQLLQEKNNQLAQERLDYKVQPKRTQLKEEDENEQKIIEEVKCEYLEKLLNLLDDSSLYQILNKQIEQQVNQAMIFLKSKIPAQNLKLKKNVRKKVKLEESKEQNQDQNQKDQNVFKDKLAQIISLTTYLSNKCNYFDIYRQNKEQLKNELEVQQKLLKEKAVQIQQQQQKQEDKIFSDSEEKQEEQKQIEAKILKEEQQSDSDSQSEQEEEKEEESNEYDSDESGESYEEEESKKERIKKAKKQIEDSSNDSYDEVD